MPTQFTMMHDTVDRYLCSEIVNVLYEDDIQNTRQAVANVEEISSRSLTLLCDEHLKPGRPVAICLQGHDLYGLIASANYDRRLGWFAVVILESCCRWSPQWFFPEHSLRLGPIERADRGQLNGTLVRYGISPR